MTDGDGDDQADTAGNADRGGRGDTGNRPRRAGGADRPATNAVTPSIAAAGHAAVAALHAENRAAAARLRACHELHQLCVAEQELLEAEAVFTAPPRPGYAVLDPLAVATAQIVAEYGVHHHRAAALVKLAVNLVTRFPAILEAMEEGWLDERTADLLAQQMRTVDSMNLAAVHRAVIDWLRRARAAGRRPGRDAILSETDRIIAAHDPGGVLARRRAALRQRGVSVRRSLDGMSDLRAHLSATDAAAINAVLDLAARQMLEQQKQDRIDAARTDPDWQYDPHTERTTDNCRADALVDALLGPANNSDQPADARRGTDADRSTGSSQNADSRQATGPDTDSSAAPAGAGTGTETRTGAGASAGTGAETGTGPGASPAGTGAGAGTASPGVPGPGWAPLIRPTITVLAPLGPDGQPEVYLPRGGPATIEALIALLARSVGAHIVLPDTTAGAADTPTTARRYRIGHDLARRIRLRDGTCRHPGCSVPADDCDVDHARPFNLNNPNSGGLTVEGNLMCLCRGHHRFKTFHNWIYRLTPDGTLTITTDTGHTLTTHPDGPLARWRARTDQPDLDPYGDADAPPDPAAPPSANQRHDGSIIDNQPWLDPTPQSTYWHRRAQQLAAERRHNNTPEPEPTDQDDYDPDPPPF